MLVMYADDTAVDTIVLAPTRDGEQVELSAFDGVTAKLVAPDGTSWVVPSALMDDSDDNPGDAIEVHLLDDGDDPIVLAQAGLWRLSLQLTDAGSGRVQRVDPLRFIVQADDGWHTLHSIRALWDDAPDDDLRLWLLLASARADVAAYAPVLPSGFQPPPSYLTAQLMQVRNMWNAGRVDPTGNAGTDSFELTPFPLDWRIKQLLRPRRGVPVVA